MSNHLIWLPFHQLDPHRSWVGYSHDHGHFTAVASTGVAINYLVDPNGGLFQHSNRDHLVLDLKHYLQAMRDYAQKQNGKARSGRIEGPPQARVIHYHWMNRTTTVWLPRN